MPNRIDIENILPLVQKPVRYIGNEWNSKKREPAENEVSACFCFPDLYEVGASNLGLEILYHTVNQSEKFVAERSYLPAPDMEEAMRARGVSLFSLESRRPVKEFDIVGITLQYELCAANVLNLLDLAGIPFYSKDRDASFPLIVGGGPMTANPEPVADFFDIILIGEGEDAITEICEAVKKCKTGKKDKETLLKTLAGIEGVYVPSFYDVSYNPDGTVKSVKPNRKEAPERITKRTADLSKVNFPTKKIVPYMDTVHNRINIEIARGCPRACRFCAATKYYGPWRLRSAEKVLELASESIANTGYGEMSFSSLSCTDYKGLNEVLAGFNSRFAEKHINVSLPSLRCDKFSLDIAKGLDNNKKTNLTFAPEAGTERLRNVIGKYLSDNRITETITLAAAMGWRAIKLYFMVGLPTETQKDIDGINNLLREIKRRVPRLNFNLTVSPFVPKAQTPFQWVAMEKEGLLREKITHLKKTVRASIKSGFVEPSIIEGALSRGDRRLSGVILRAWKKGARFDQWKEQFNFDVWSEAFREETLDYAFYAHRERAENEVFPWDHLFFNFEKGELLDEYKKGLSESESIQEKEAVQPSAPLVSRNIRPLDEKVVQRARLRFERKGILRFLSHLEQIELMRNMLRRSGLPVTYTSGFSPQPKASFGPAISVGYESESEYVDLSLSKRVESKEIEARINTSLPDGFRLLEVKKLPLFFPALDSLVNVAVYRIKCDTTDEKIREFLSRPEIIIEKKKEHEIKKIDAKPLIRQLKQSGGYITLELRFGPKYNLKCEKIIQALCSFDENSAKMLPVTRTGFLAEKKDGTVIEP